MKKYLIFVLIVLILLFAVALYLNNRQQSSLEVDPERQTTAQNKYLELSEKYTLKYKTYKEAVSALEQKTGAINSNPEVAFYVPGKFPREDGYPYFVFWSTINQEKNICLNGYMNLVTGESESHRNVCVIYN